MKRNKTALIFQILIPILIIALCLGYLGKMLGSPDFIWNAKNIQGLDEKKESVLGLTAGAAGISSAITVLPGDICTPIAEELSDLVGYFLVITSAILLEKYLVTITGSIGFFIIIPLGCILYLLHLLKNNISLKRAGVRIALFGLAIYLVIPASSGVTKLIEGTYQQSIQNAIEETQNAVAAIEGYSEETEALEDKNWFEKTKDNISTAVENVTNGTENVIAKAKEALNRYIEATAIMIITCCVIPIVVILVFMWLAKILLGINITSPDIRQIADRMPTHRPNGSADHRRHGPSAGYGEDTTPQKWLDDGGDKP